MRKRIGVILNENQLEYVKDHLDESQPMSKFIVESYMNNRKFKISSKIRKRSKKKKLYISVTNDLYEKLQSVEIESSIGSYIINNIFINE